MTQETPFNVAAKTTWRIHSIQLAYVSPEVNDVATDEAKPIGALLIDGHKGAHGACRQNVLLLPWEVFADLEGQMRVWREQLTDGRRAQHDDAAKLAEDAFRKGMAT